MKITAGIDGGGTSTTLVLSKDGREQERKTFGAFNLNSIGEERFRGLLTELFDTVAQAGECEGICIGAAGISNPRVEEITLEIAQKYEFSKKLLLKGDQDIALYGAMSGKAGAILIAGTGSICTGRGKNGRTVRAGGWGHLIDDGGSGYAIGKDVLKAVVMAYDGRADSTLLTEMVYKHWQVSDIEGIIAKTYDNPDKSNIAALSRLAEEGAKRGDKASDFILFSNAAMLCMLIDAVYERLEEEDRLSLCLMGGLLSHDTEYRKMVVDLLMEGERNIDLKDPDMDAAAGAALWAWDMHF